MRIEDRDEFVDAVAQAVIDRIEERDRVAGLVEMVVRRVIELQQQEKQQEQESAEATEAPASDSRNGNGNGAAPSASAPAALSETTA